MWLQIISNYFDLCIYKSVAQRQDRNLNYECSFATNPVVYPPYSLFILMLPTCLAYVTIILYQLLSPWLFGLNCGGRLIPLSSYCSLQACNCMWLYFQATNAFFSNSVKCNSVSVFVVILPKFSNYCNSLQKLDLLDSKCSDSLGKS